MSGYFHPLDFMLVTVSNLVVHLPGLPPSVLPIEAKIFMYKSSKRKTTLYQFHVILAYIITDYKCQDLTFDQVYVDLKHSLTGFTSAASAYIQLSRCRVINQLSIVHSFDSSELTTELSKDLHDKLKWKEELD